jgi:hypothetical protein
VGRRRPKKADVVCGMPIRRGIDLNVLKFLKDVDLAFRNMRINLVLESSYDIEIDCVKRYLV